MPKVVVIYHSGYGHTQRMAQSVAEGAGAELLAIDADGNLPEGGWETLRRRRHHHGLAHLHGQRELAVQEVCRRLVQALVHPGLEGQAVRRLHQQRRDERRQAVHAELPVHLAMQHGGIWVSQGMLPSNSKAALRNDANYLGSYSGAVAQSPSDAGAGEMSAGDLETARSFGRACCRRCAKFPPNPIFPCPQEPHDH
jgi:NAD(P)H dehydrogenase (quinone)